MQQPKHPYSNAPRRAFWSKAVANDYRPDRVFTEEHRLISADQRVVSAGSCFAANLVPFLESAGLSYLRTETRHPAFRNLPTDNFGYEKFSAAYGNIYTARQLLQTLRRALGTFAPAEDRWPMPDRVVDPYRPGLRYAATSDREFDLLTAQHLRAVRRAFDLADVFIFTLGLTEAWVSRQDGAVFPACPGTVAGQFDPSRHAFVNFSVAEVVADLNAFVAGLRSINAGARIILTVSPVPLVATATARHVLAATVYSKSVLRAAAEEVATQNVNISYFPAYEIVTGPQAPSNYFDPDRRSVSEAGVEAVMTAFMAHCEAPSRFPKRQQQGRLSALKDLTRSVFSLRRKPGPAASTISPASDMEADKLALARRISAAECEELMADSD